MDILSNLILTFSVSLIVGISTYLIQYCSAISPCNIEFDDRKQYEIKLMNSYNQLADRIFYIAMTVIMLCVIVSMSLENTGVMLFVVILELVYFIVNIFAMSLMYIRSKIYWEMDSKREKQSV